MVQRLAAELGVAAIGEGMREYLVRTGTDLHSLGHDGLRDVVRRLWEERVEAEARHASFVADRSAYDFAAFWLYYHFADGSEETTRFFADSLRPGRYDQLLVLPWGTIPLLADGVRSPDPWVQLHVQILIEGLLSRHASAPVTTLQAVGLDARVEEALRRCR